MLNVKKLISVTWLPALAIFPYPAVAEDSTSQDWQMQMLLAPTPQQIEMEQRKSRVFIYSRVKESDLDRVMDEQFGRIEHMMFINPLVREPGPKADETQPADKAVWVEQDDGC